MSTREAYRLLPGWIQVNHLVWEHWSGWTVRHCGHPTANWPYVAVAPEGRQVVAPSGRGFQTRNLAQEAAEIENAKSMIRDPRPVEALA